MISLLQDVIILTDCLKETLQLGKSQISLFPNSGVEINSVPRSDVYLRLFKLLNIVCTKVSQNSNILCMFHIFVQSAYVYYEVAYVYRPFC